MRSQTPFLTEKKRICDRKFVRSSDIGRVASGRKYLELTVSLIHMTSFSLYFFQKFGDETDADFGGGVYYLSATRRATIQSNCCAQSFTHWRTARKQENWNSERAILRYYPQFGGGQLNGDLAVSVSHILCLVNAPKQALRYPDPEEVALVSQSSCCWYQGKHSTLSKRKDNWIG